MASYVIANSEITNPELFAEFTRDIVTVTEEHGGRYLVRGGSTEVVDGDWTPNRVVIIEFEDLDHAHGFVTDPNYVRLKDVQSRSSVTSTVIVEGV